MSNIRREAETEGFNAREVQISPLNEIVDASRGSNHNVHSPPQLLLLGRDRSSSIHCHALQEAADFLHLVVDLKAKLAGWGQDQGPWFAVGLATRLLRLLTETKLLDDWDGECEGLAASLKRGEEKVAGALETCFCAA